MEDIDNIKMALFGSEYTRGLVKRVETVETNLSNFENAFFAQIKTSEDKLFQTISVLDNTLEEKEKKHIQAFDNYMHDYCGTKCKGSDKLRQHEEQHQKMTTYIDKEKDRALEERKSRRTIIIAIIAGSLPGLITLIKDWFKP